MRPTEKKDRQLAEYLEHNTITIVPPGVTGLDNETKAMKQKIAERAERALRKEAMRNRHYEFPEDRFEFRRWVKSQGYGRLDEIRGVLTLELNKAGKRLRYELPLKFLESSRHDWRFEVAYTLRQIRKAFNTGV